MSKLTCYQDDIFSEFVEISRTGLDLPTDNNKTDLEPEPMKVAVFCDTISDETLTKVYLPQLRKLQQIEI